MSSRRSLKRRHPDGKDAEQVREVFPEGAGVDLGRQVGGGGGDDPDLHASRPGAAQALEFPFLEKSQQFGLEGQGQGLHFIQKQAAAVGFFQTPGLGSDRPREGAFLYTEQLDLQQIFRQRGAIDFEKGILGPGTQGVDHPGEQGLAGA